MEIKPTDRQAVFGTIAWERKGSKQKEDKRCYNATIISINGDRLWRT